jgi:hypothetical protein
VYLGGGCLDAAPEVRDFIARTQIPVASTLMGLGTYPAQDPLALQMLGMHGTVFANYSVDQVRGVGLLGSCLLLLGGCLDRLSQQVLLKGVWGVESRWGSQSLAVEVGSVSGIEVGMLGMHVTVFAKYSVDQVCVVCRLGV